MVLWVARLSVRDHGALQLRDSAISVFTEYPHQYGLAFYNLALREYWNVGGAFCFNLRIALDGNNPVPMAVLCTESDGSVYYYRGLRLVSDEFFDVCEISPDRLDDGIEGWDRMATQIQA
jgi:hypothetical protein